MNGTKFKCKFCLVSTNPPPAQHPRLSLEIVVTPIQQMVKHTVLVFFLKTAEISLRDEIQFHYDAVLLL